MFSGKKLHMTKSKTQTNIKIQFSNLHISKFSNWCSVFVPL